MPPCATLFAPPAARARGVALITPRFLRAMMPAADISMTPLRFDCARMRAATAFASRPFMPLLRHAAFDAALMPIDDHCRCHFHAATPIA